MKKLLAFLLCLSLIFALAACSKPESQTQQPAQAENQPVQPEQSGQSHRVMSHQKCPKEGIWEEYHSIHCV